MKRNLLSFLLIAVLVVGLCACTDKDKNADKTLTLELDVAPSTLDPLLAEKESERLIVQNIFEGLVRVDENGNIVPGVAESYEINGNVYLFHLNSQAKWSDGEPLTASDFVFGITRALLPETKSPYASSLFAIENASALNQGQVGSDALGIKAIDDHTLQIQLAQTSHDFLRMLATAAGMPCRADFFEQSSGRYGMEKDTLITNGPFTLQRWNDQILLSLVRNKEYAGSRSVRPSGIILKFDQKEEERITRLTNAESDLGTISSDLMQKAQDAGLTVYPNYNICWAIVFNQQNPVFSKLALRTALAGTIDREEFSPLLPSYLTTATAFIPPAATAGGKQYRTAVGDSSLLLHMDADAAQQAYTKEIQSFATSQNGKIDPSSAPQLVMLCPDTEMAKTLASYAIQQWQKTLGAYVTLEVVPLSQLEQRVKAGDCQMALMPFESNDNSAYTLLSRFYTSSASALPLYSSANFNQMLEASQAAPTDEAVCAALLEAEKYLLEQAAVVPLAFEATCFAARSTVDGFRLAFSANTIDLTALGKSDD